MSETDEEEALGHPPIEAIGLTAVLKALGDPTRLDIVCRLARAEPEELTCGAFGCATKQLATHHLKTLREAGVTFTREEGRNRYVRLRRADLEQRFPGLLDRIIESGRAGK